MKFILVMAAVLLHSVCFSLNISSNLTATYDPKGRAVKLAWQNNDERITGFVLQKSSDNNKWSDLANIGVSPLNENKIEKWLDQYPDPNQNYYRLRVIMEDNEVEYSSPIMLTMGKPASSWTLFPVPVSSVLNIQYSGSEPIKGVITVLVQNSRGIILKRSRSSSLTRKIEIPVSNLGRGVYDVKIMIGNENVWNQRFVK